MRNAIALVSIGSIVALTSFVFFSRPTPDESTIRESAASPVVDSRVTARVAARNHEAAPDPVRRKAGNDRRAVPPAPAHSPRAQAGPAQAAPAQASAPSPQAGDPGATKQENDAEPVISANEYIAALRASGETEGIAAFPPPGTNPPKPGVIVPDEYQLPEGYVRHYQTTDDGQQLAPVLTLSPDYDLLDETGEPIELPADRILPPHLVPPDLDIEILDVPDPGARSATGP